jgi:hypothetical protein
MPLVREIAGIAASPEPALVRLERALDALFAAYSSESGSLAPMLLDGWARAGRDKQQRLALAWHREQIRLAVADILEAGQRQGVLGRHLDVGATAALAVACAEAGALQATSQGGAVGPRDQARALLGLIRSGA